MLALDSDRVHVKVDEGAPLAARVKARQTVERGPRKPTRRL